MSKRTFHSPPLRVLVPLLVTGLGLLTILTARIATDPLVKQQIISEQTDEAILEMGEFQLIIETAGRFADENYEQELMSLASNTRTPMDMMIIAPDGRISAASKFDVIGNAVNDTLNPELVGLYEKAQRSAVPLTHLAANAQTLTTFGRVCRARLLAQTSASACGVAVFQRDLLPIIEAHLALTERAQLTYATGIGLTALILILLLRGRLIKRIEHLQTTLQKYVSDDTRVRTNLEGDDEIAKIAQGVDNMLDTIEMARAESAFSERKFRALFQDNIEGMVVTSKLGYITDINPAAERIFGYEAGELHGSPIKRLMPPEDAERHDSYIQRYAQIGGTRVVGKNRELLGKRQDGSLFPLTIGVAEIRSDKTQYFFATITDISEIRTLEEQVQRAQKMDAIGQLAGGIAHDFNNLLGIVIGNLDLLRRKLPDDVTLTKHVEKALGASTRGADLTRRLLNFSRQESKQASVVDVSSTINGIHNLIDQSLTARIDLTLTSIDPIWPIEVDVGQLEDVLVNLALNARDAMPNGGELRIEVSNTTCHQPLKADFVFGDGIGDYVQICVSDTGNGIPPEIQDKIFEPFFSTKEEGSGTGLGLSMVYGFVKRCRGCISLYSEVGLGTAVRLYIPKARSAHTSPDAPEKDQSMPTGNETILIVDDETELREIADDILTNLGYRTLLASDAKEALALLEKHPEVALLFSDVMMPGELSGFDLAKKSRKAYPNLKIVLASGFTGNLVADEDQAFIQHSLLTKPYRDVEVAQLIRHKLDEDTTALD